MKTAEKWMLSIGTGLLASLCLGFQALAYQPQRSATDWQVMARIDLDTVRQLIEQAHPGVIDEQNPQFRDWMESGYREALQLIPRVISYDTAMSAVRFYVTGFLDGHLVYSDDVRGDAPIYHTGWRVDVVKGDYVVTALAPDWPTPLPPLGSRLLECDGRQPDRIVQEDVMPFSERRNFAVSRGHLAQAMRALHLAGMELKRCRFQIPFGTSVELAVSYQAGSTDQYFGMRGPQPMAPSRANGFELKDGVLWVRAANFNLQQEQAGALETMLKDLEQVQGATHLVFDVRGNGGGDSGVGARIFNAATGGMDYGMGEVGNLPRVYAQWRVSDVTVDAAKVRLERATSLYGASSEQARDANLFLDKVKAAQMTGQPWVEQPGGYRLTRAEVQRRNGRLRRFAGTVALLTDARCASACLDFADQVRLIPGSIHLGQTTSADTVYIDVGLVKLPSGNRLVLPLKVWRNRVRGNNEALVPDLTFDVNMEDDPAVYAATLAALKAPR